MKLTLCLLACAIGLQAATANFNDYPNAASNPSAHFFSSGGLGIVGTENLFIVGNPTGEPFPSFGVTPVSNGTVFLAGGGDRNDDGTARNGTIIMTSPGTTFSLSSVDLDRALTQTDAQLAAIGAPPNARTINVVGTLFGGGTVTATFTLNGGTAFQNFTFPSTWQNLVAVTFSGNNDGTTGASASANALFAMDNIVYTPGTTTFTCNYSLSPGSAAVSSFGDSGTITVIASPGCTWKVSAAPPWMNGFDFDGGGRAGVGNGTLDFGAQSNPGAARSGVVTIAGLSFPVEQGSGLIGSSLNNNGRFAQVTSEGTWKFTLNTINLGTTSALERFSFFDNGGSPLRMPWTFPQTPAATAAGPLVGWTLDRTLAPNAQLVMESTGPDNIAALVGWGQVQANDRIGAFGTFSNPTFGWNAVVPLETRNTVAYYLAFDNTGPITTGVAIAYPGGPQGANINVIIRDDAGAQIGGGTITLPAQGHDSFMLNAKYPITAGKRGTVEFDRPTGGPISVLGLRANQFSATASALTTLPVLAGIPSGGGGSITHATYNGGFTSVFYVVNTGTTSGTFTLSFADENTGAPIQFPLSLPQSGTTTTTSSLSRTLAPGAMLVAETQAQDALAPVVASAQLTTTGGNISAFEVFRWTTFSQEASVPLENRTPPSFVLVFDNTNGQSTGVAVSNRLSAAAGVDIPVTIRDDAGVQLFTSTIHLSAQGHTSFMLPDKYAAAVGKRGMIEFTVPTGGSISVVGLRAKADGTLTTIPVLTR